MISRVLPLIRPSLRLCGARCSLARGSAHFCTNTPSVKNVAELVAEELKSQLTSKPDLSQTENSFEQNGWKISYNGTKIELFKELKNHTVRLVTYAKPPATQNDEETGNQQEEGRSEGEDGEFNNEYDYVQITAYVSKKNNPKCMCIVFVCDTKNTSEINSLFFANSYEDTQKLTTQDGGHYTGPQMTSIYDGLLSELEVFIERNLTINSNILQSLAEHAINYEHQFYLEWLQDLKKIVQ